MTNVNIGKSQVPQGQGQSSQKDGKFGFLPTALGIGGQFAGGALGALVGGGAGTLAEPGGGTLLGGIGGERIGQVGGGAIGQGLGEYLNQILSGQKTDPGKIASETAQGGIYGALPGSQLVKGIANPVIRAAEQGGERFLGGALAGGGTQAVRNIQQNKPITEGIGGQALATGAMNTIVPGIGKTLGLGSKVIKTLGGIGVKSADRILERQAQPELAAVQHLFGKEAVSTGGGKSIINPQVKSIIDKYFGGKLAPQADISKFKPLIDKASADVESKLQPILKDPQYAVPKADIKKIIADNLGTFFGTSNKKMYKSIPLKLQKMLGSLTKMEVRNTSRQTTEVVNNVDLSSLKEMQREIGKVGGSDWGHPPTNELEKWARQTYTDIGKVYDEKLGGAAGTKYKDLINQHKILLKARDAYQGLTRGKGTLPIEVGSAELAKEKIGSGLGMERAKELGLRSLPVIAGGGAQLIPGVPKPLKEAALLGTGLYGAAEFGPHLNPEQALKIGNILKNLPSADSGVLQRVLQQLGVRLPGVGQ